MLEYRGGSGEPSGFNRTFPHFDYNIPNLPSQLGMPMDDSIVSSLAISSERRKQTFRLARLKRDVVNGTILGTLAYYSGAMLKQVYNGRINAIGLQLSEDRISKKVAKERKVEEVKKYNGFLYKVGYITEDEYIFYVTQYAEKLGIKNICEEEREEPQRKR